MSELLSFRYVGAAVRLELEKLRIRYASLRDVDPAQVVFAPTAEAFSIVGLDAERADTFGPDDFPISAFIAENPDRSIELSMSNGLVREGLKGLERRALGFAALLPKEELKQLAERLEAWPSVQGVELIEAGLNITLSDQGAFLSQSRALGLDIPVERQRAIIRLRSRHKMDQLIDRLSIVRGRVGEVERITNETSIRTIVSLDQTGDSYIDTGIGYFDHMLEQIAKHAGISLNIVCKGDLEVDPHHTIEDVALALGEALNKALGERRGIGRFGFELPMDETRAGVWIDLSGRPFARFDGDIPGTSVGEFPVEMTPHVFRSLAETLKAAIHVSVEGENAHHMIESCFKAFGRALRQGIRIEGNDVPSTKGVL